MIDVIVYEYNVKKPVKVIPCKTESQALKVEKGLNRNMNHNRFYTMIGESSKLKEAEEYGLGHMQGRGAA